MSPTTRSRSCVSFWGPFRPLVGGHGIEEASSSSIVPTFIVALWRISIAVFLLATFIYYAAIGEYQLQFYSSWCHLGLGLSYLYLAIISTVSALKKTPRRASLVADSAILLYQIFASSAIYLTVVYWILLFNPPLEFKDFAQHGVNSIAVVIDLLLTLRINFRLFYILFFVVYTFVYLGFAWIRFAITKDWVYNFLDYRDKSIGVVIGTYIGMFVWGLIVGLLVLLLSRLSRLPCIPGSSNDKQSERVTSPV